MVSTYSEYQARPSSEKIGLVRVEASSRLVGWALYSGSIYSISLDVPVIVSIAEDGTALVEVSSLGSVTAGKYYYDRGAKVLYLRATASGNPNGSFVSCVRAYCFSNVSIAAPWDFGSGYEVTFLPLLKDTSDFGVQLDNQNQIGAAIEGSGSIVFHNDRTFWAPIFEKLYWENQRAYIYSWNRGLPISEAKIIYRGSIQTKRYNTTQVTFGLKDLLNELRTLVPLVDISDLGSPRVPDRLLTAKQRQVFGFVKSHKPTNIDQVLDGYPLTGTFSATLGSDTITGSGTLFLAELNPGDDIYIGDEEEAVTVKSVASNTSLTLTDEFAGVTVTGASATVDPSDETPKRYINREFLLAGHPICEKSTTVVMPISLSRFEVASVADLFPGDIIVLNGETLSIDRIVGNIVKTVSPLVTLPLAGDTVTRLSVTNVYINDRKLTYLDDYDYDPTTAILTLTSVAEKNVAPVLQLTGTVTFTSGNRSVSGTGTLFTTELKPGSWIRSVTQFEYFEVLQILSDTSLELRSAATYSVTSAGSRKNPDYYDEGVTVLSCDLVGKTEDGTINGALIYKGAQIVRDLLTQIGIDDLIETTSFNNSEVYAPQMLGLVIPQKLDDQRAPKTRDIINQVNQSIFGSLVQNEDFQLEYKVLRPIKPSSSVQLKERDILKFEVKCDSSRIAKTVRIEYRHKEYDPLSKAESISVFDHTSSNAQYLARSENTYIQRTLLSESSDARVMAGRFSMILETSSNVISLDTKLQGSRVQVTDPIDFEHEKVFQRTGSTSSRKFGAVQSAKKDIGGAKLELEDLANAFTRVAIITENTADDWTNSSDQERLYGGFITDAYGMINNDAETHGINLIW